MTMRAPYGPGAQAAALFRAAESEREIAALENLTALIYNDLGNADRAMAALARAQEVAGALPGDERFAASMADMKARIYRSQGRSAEISTQSRLAIERARQAWVLRTVVAAQLTLAQALEGQGRDDEALAALSESVDTARQRGGVAPPRRALGRMPRGLLKRGRHEQATAHFEEAVRVFPPAFALPLAKGPSSPQQRSRESCRLGGHFGFNRLQQRPDRVRQRNRLSGSLVGFHRTRTLLLVVFRCTTGSEEARRRPAPQRWVRHLKTPVAPVANGLSGCILDVAEIMACLFSIRSQLRSSRRINYGLNVAGGLQP